MTTNPQSLSKIHGVDFSPLQTIMLAGSHFSVMQFSLFFTCKSSRKLKLVFLHSNESIQSYKQQKLKFRFSSPASDQSWAWPKSRPPPIRLKLWGFVAAYELYILGKYQLTAPLGNNMAKAQNQKKWRLTFASLVFCSFSSRRGVETSLPHKDELRGILENIDVRGTKWHAKMPHFRFWNWSFSRTKRPVPKL